MSQASVGPQVVSPQTSGQTPQSASHVLQFSPAEHTASPQISASQSSGHPLPLVSTAGKSTPKEILIRRIPSTMVVAESQLTSAWDAGPARQPGTAPISPPKVHKIMRSSHCTSTTLVTDEPSRSPTGSRHNSPACAVATVERLARRSQRLNVDVLN